MRRPGYIPERCSLAILYLSFHLASSWPDLFFPEVVFAWVGLVALRLVQLAKKQYCLCCPAQKGLRRL